MRKKEIRLLPAIGLAAALSATASMAAEAGRQAAADRPLNPAAGRVRTLTPVVTISDQDGSLFYFKRPSQPQFGPDGSIYVLDEKQVLRFDPQGRFVRNYYRPGQGPGELNYVAGYGFDGKDIIVMNSSRLKFVRYDPEGEFISETTPAPNVGPLTLLGCDESQALALKNIFPRMRELKESEGTLENKNPILAIPLTGGKERQIGTFSTRTYYKMSSAGSVGGGASLPFGKYLIIPWGEKTLALCEDEEYAVKILDIGTGSIRQTFRRAYPRVKTPPEDRDGISGGAMIDGKVVKRPAPEFAADVVHLLARGEELWVVTSTRIEDKGVLVDVFDRGGAYTDSFYLPVPKWPEKHLTRPDPLALQGDFLLALEKAEDGTYLLRKYEIGV
jgi:hypothetical protein